MIPDEVVNVLLSLPKKGEDLFKEFRQKRLLTGEISFNEPIKKQIDKKLIKNKLIKTVKRSNQVSSIEVNRNILGKLLSHSINHNKRIDFSEALKYPLSPTPLSISHPDAKKRSCNKSDLLLPLILPNQSDSYRNPCSNNLSAYVYDVMVGIRTMNNIPDTFESLTWNFLKLLQTDYQRVDLVADSYRDMSIKSGTRNERGMSSKIIIKSEKSKIPSNFQSFLSEGANKTRLIEIMFDVIKKNKVKVFNLIRCQRLFLSVEGSCEIVTRTSINNCDDLCSNQEEADTRLILHAKHPIDHASYSIIIRSPSGDTDIIVLAVSLLFDFKEKIFLDSGSSGNRRLIHLASFELPDDYRAALIGYHAFTGNDYVSSFFTKGKKKCWNKLKEDPKYVQCFSSLGTRESPSEEQLQTLEEYVCVLYSTKLKNVNDARYQLFKRKNELYKKSIDLALLPPCQAVLNLHSKRANFEAYLWKQTLNSMINVPNYVENGWDANCEIFWLEQEFPDDIADILFEEANEESSDDDYGDDIASDDEFDQRD